MEAQLAWLDDPQVFRVNQLPAHSDHQFFASTAAMEAGDNELVQSLNGTWEFAFAPTPAQRPVGFWEPTFNRAGFTTITVPGEIELQGFSQINYINTLYPWAGKTYRRPVGTAVADQVDPATFANGNDNTVGAYVRHFELPNHWADREVHIMFEGVERAMYVWLNGHFVGYAEDSFTPSEFDLTPYLQPGDNLLAVEVFKHSTASWLEDQDMFRFSGIFRDVNLVCLPTAHVTDLKVEALYDPVTHEGQFGATLQLTNDQAVVSAQLTAPDGTIVWDGQTDQSQDFKFPVTEIGVVQAWDHHHPTLYQLTLTVQMGAKTVEVIPQVVGFRHVEITPEAVLQLNGQRLVINGVNRHEWNCHRGRAIEYQDMLTDLELFHQNNINAVRTCHYPDQLAWYDLCDRHGIYMMAENNLETHGTWQKMGAVEPSYNVPGSLNEWLEACLDRARTNYEVLKNHPAILFWSLGNESYAGEVIAAMDQFYHTHDQTRLTHYEGVCYTPEYRDRISDFESRMYLAPDDVEAYLQNQPDKPFVECEYMHSMGNSVGGLGSYNRLVDEYPQYAGGFIWDFIDQALEITDPVTGQSVMRYGGDFDDRHADYEFAGDGLVFANRQPKPAMQEVRYYYGLHE
ncbi:glycoside hydrolase family 2 TIM barrel-domain containing protein [Limosilactobacillus equigenerosi]|uniref:beta-galactosidase n=1 Tax=Limosilactobacillus equigenerosi DSM 18793 = JCM 14505 TaxID=1423742 RepID=A0A0R1UMN1_9LACO|nr:glycoside hydrolase family 2 TIM barrel-domain containing protein [Limosilactobacillus equigenerosi]KRL92627.1 Beta-galactosidase large subunit [Limosilactobacillus equigenerosi DSM 18793 = JCM 14505]